MRITIVGAGAIGGVIGAYLARAGENVTFVDIEKEHVEIIRSKGIKINLKDDSFTEKVSAFTLEEFVNLDMKLEVVLLCVKAQHTNQSLEPLKNMLTDNSVVVSMQNGLCEPVISHLIGEEKTIGCFVNLFADYKQPGEIDYGGVGSLYIGELNGNITERIKDIQSLLQHWGDAKVTNNILGYIWGKLSYLIVLVATALTD